MDMPEMYQKKKFKNKKLEGCRYEYSTWMGSDLRWVDTFRDIKGEKALTDYYKARADYEEHDFQRKINMWNLDYKRLAK
jgi:hypothetical protein